MGKWHDFGVLIARQVCVSTESVYRHDLGSVRQHRIRPVASLSCDYPSWISDHHIALLGVASLRLDLHLLIVVSLNGIDLLRLLGFGGGGLACYSDRQ